MVERVRSLLARGMRTAGRIAVAPVVDRWPPYSRLLLISDASQWVIGREMQQLAIIARRLGIQVADGRLLDYTRRQAVFFGSHFNLLSGRAVGLRNRIATAYFHGRPGSGDPAFDLAYNRLRELHEKIDRIQVSHTEMRDLVLEAGVHPERVFLIPIGIDVRQFPFRSESDRLAARRDLRIPDAAVVVGSFQKDGVGWEEGLEPKMEKGPDVFVETVERLKARVPTLFVLLTGPARGFVKAGLERAGIPYHHEFVTDTSGLAKFYHALDLYLVTSRQEGGPKTLLESMASGVPVVTTRVGQAMDLVRHGENAWMVDVDDVEGLTHVAYETIAGLPRTDMLKRGREMAEANSYESQLPLWQRFMTDFVTATR
jgi:glycosyltransferase involved in cell wall biosynthesis